MYAVGRLGSYITQGVYTVSGPFHPFGGAVDMVVVQQQDGSLKSSPWYVRFGKFQGVLKAKERVVDINVNGVDADFHMYLDPRGEAYFLREIDSEEVVETVSSHSSSHEEMNGKGQDMITVKAKSMNYDFDQCNSVNDVSNGEVLSRTNSKRSRILGFVLGRRSMKEHIISKEENNSNVGRMGSLESAEIAADLLEMRWSTNLSSRSRDSRNDNEDITGGRLEGSLVLHEQHFVNKLDSSGVNHEMPAMEVKETIVADDVHDVNENVDEEVPSLEVKETVVADIVHDVNENDDEEVPSMEVKETIVADVQDVNENIDEEVPSFEVKETIVADVVHDVNETVDEEVSSMEVKETVVADIVHDVNENDDEEVPSMEVKETIAADVVRDVNENIDEEVPSIEVKETIVADVVHDFNETVNEEGLRSPLDDFKEAEVGLITAQGSLEIVPDSYTEVASNQGDTSFEVVACNSIAVPICQNVDDNLIKEVNETNEIRAPMNPNGEFQDVSADSVLMEQVNEEFVEEHLIFGDLDESKPSINQVNQEVKQGGSESMSITYGSDSLTIRTYQEPFKDDVETVKGNIRRCTTNLDIPKSCEVKETEVGRQAKSLPNMWCQFNDPVPENHEESQFYSPVGKFRSSNWDLLREDASRIKKANLEKELPLNADNLSKDLKDGNIAGGAPNIVDGAVGSWRLWPFTRLGSKSVSEKEQNSKKDSVVDNLRETDGEKEEISPKSDKTHTRALTPTPEQLASLNLAEGQNSVTFTFSTSVLGPQKVDARIYLWRWDSRIVISDVDGTITKSDVLGQFMPLVGRDWSHIGVTHLFSAIKENGYQMLYLSARAISQASITRQFLFNLKQDGKALPDGPVVISPDGLFPSLFREVIRRAPHEFKIACLEDIKACFPHDRNPFYAGFGNRDTDEFSYLKVGIPKGKIFIINPKGEVVINRCIDSKSYASLHALVNGIFPPISVQEEEDYNSWNFWKLPPPTID